MHREFGLTRLKVIKVFKVFKVINDFEGEMRLE